VKIRTPESFTHPAAAAADRIFEKAGVALTLGGEPTFLPEKPEGLEWSITATGPEKLTYAYAFCEAVQRHLPGLVSLFSPGKLYPGEPNPRWVISLLGNHSGTPLVPPPLPGRRRGVTAAWLRATRAALVEALELPSTWNRARDPVHPANQIWVLPLDHTAEVGWMTEQWPTGKRATLTLLKAEGPAGLRLPLGDLPPDTLRRALVIEWRSDHLAIFLPPLLQAPFVILLEWWIQRLHEARIDRVRFQGYLPQDDEHRWWRLGLAADPGVLEINLPPCRRWEEYAWWMHLLEQSGKEVGMRSWRAGADGHPQGTGGGNHLLFGGPSIEENPFFTRGPWLASLLRFFQRHPVLAYLFSGIYVGTSSQAPRPDESGTSLWDLEMAYGHLASLDGGDHRFLIGETLRHLHTDASGNTHRCETSFDKFWSPNSASGCLGLIEFRAIESLPRSDWSAAVALLWRCIAAHTLLHPQPAELIAFGNRLHDAFFLPAHLWRDLETILEMMRDAGMELDAAIYRAIWEWRFPLLLDTEIGGVRVQIRRACEGWPLLCETPNEGGSTSRFVDTSVHRIEILAATEHFPEPVLVNGRPLQLVSGPVGSFAGLRYRQSALYPSLHPGIPIQLPLTIHLRDRPGASWAAFQFHGTGMFEPCEVAAPALGKPVQRHGPESITYDLRLP